ncbi:putative trifunctional purine biosynthetic protein adenosine-3-lik e, partial [Apostichopus japonicus]
APDGDFQQLASWCHTNQINLVVVGPESPLAAGVVDVLNAAGVPCFGPTKAAAELEASKAFSKAFMDKYEIPTAKWKTFADVKAACKHIISAPYKALVVKASGLAAGKGVVVAKTKEEACSAVQDILQDKKFGSAGETVVIEEVLEGEEVSVLAFSDGTTVACLLPAQDHKRVSDGDEGPNTGGMGAYCPYPKMNQTTLEMIKTDVIQKAVDGMQQEGRKYVGILYAGLMITVEGPKTLEFNCRFGDPETQALLPLLKSDLYRTMKACVDGQLHLEVPIFEENKSAVGVIIASGGYPGSYKKGFHIKGIPQVEKEGILVFHSGTSLKDNKVLTSGGRVLAVVSTEHDLESAAAKALYAAQKIQFDGAFHRKDIAKRGCDFLKEQRSINRLTYAGSGVNINDGNKLVKAIKPLASATTRRGCKSVIGGFGGLFDMDAAGYKDPLLVSGTDGVGTKLKIAQSYGNHSTVGQDLVAMCVNDILAHGAEALFFLDYFACGKLEVAVATDVIAGIAEGCKLAGCALLGGETAEMPGMYDSGEYDLAGFAVGAVEREALLPRTCDIQEGDVVLGVGSSGIHSNGFSLVRKIIDKEGLSLNDLCPFQEDKQLGEVLLTPTRIYSKSLLPSIRSGKVKAFSHITGGGLSENIPRVLPENVKVELDASQWTVPAVFGWLSQSGNIDEQEMSRTFNCGIGAVLIVKAENANEIQSLIEVNSETVWRIGSVKSCSKNDQQVVITGLSQALQRSYLGQILSQERRKLKVAVLISGTGTNLQALIDFTRNSMNRCDAEICLVMSNKPEVEGLAKAKRAGIPTKIISHKDFKSRVEFDMKLHQTLSDVGVDLICLAGFMRILSGEFVRKWRGALLNIHPSLLPSFPGMHAQKQAIEAGVRLSGCSVHFVVEEVDAGAIIVQKAVPVLPEDSEESLTTRIRQMEWIAYPEALQLVASGKVRYGNDGKVEWQS